MAPQLLFADDDTAISNADPQCIRIFSLKNILSVVQAAGGSAENIVKLNLYITNKEAYLSAQKQLGESYRRHMGKHFPAMALVEVRSLYEPGAMVEIDGMAVF